MKPAASVVMTVYKDFRFLDEAVESILLQDFPDIELILVDDGNRCDEMFMRIAERDPRIRLIINPANLGTAAAANRGIDAAQSEIIVRLDADDVAEPARVGRLVRALADDPDLGLVGSPVTPIDEAGKVLGAWPAPETDVDIRWTILFHNPFYHSAIAFRRSLFEQAGRYRPQELISQDHYLWFDMLPLCRAMNVPEPLTRYRINSQGLSYKEAANARARTHEIRKTSWQRLGLEYNLYDDAFAADISEWVRGHELPVEKRAAAYVEILRILRAFVDASSPRIGPRYRAELQQLVTASIDRMLRTPPAGWRGLMSTLRACSSVDRLQTVKSLFRELVPGLGQTDGDRSGVR